MNHSFTPEDQPIAEINIIPFVDIILVLLIIFMVATPFLIKTGFSLQLPDASSASKITSSNVHITIHADGTVFLNKNSFTLEQLTSQLKNNSAISPDTPVIIAADKNILHGKVIAVINAVQAAGLKRVAISATTTSRSKK